MIIDGKIASREYFESLKLKIIKLNPKLRLTVIQVGANPESIIYINLKRKKAEELGIQFEHLVLSEQSTEEQITSEIDKLNCDLNVGGIILQLPLPNKFDSKKIIESINPFKDIDCLTSLNLGRFFSGNSNFIPATALGIIRLLEYYKIEIEGKNICIIGKSDLVGKPLSIALMNLDATVIVCHIKTNNIEDFTLKSDVIITATGAPKFFTSKYFKNGQTVIDVGTTKGIDGKLYGDVDYVKVSKIVENITPVPGGVGPMTVYGLIENFVNLNTL